MDYSIPQGAYAGRMPDAVDDARYQFDPVLLAQAAAAAASVYESEPDYFEGTPLDDMRKLASLSEKERLYMAYKRCAPSSLLNIRLHWLTIFCSFPGDRNWKTASYVSVLFFAPFANDPR